MGDILLACVPADRPRLDALAKAFIDGGHRVGWQHEALWTLAPQVCVVAAWSRNSADAQWLANLARGCARRGKLVSIRLDASDPPRGIERHRVIDLSMWPAVTADRGVDRLLTVAAEVSARAVETPARGQRFVPVAGALAVVAVLLVLAWWQRGTSPPPHAEPAAPVAGDAGVAIADVVSRGDGDAAGAVGSAAGHTPDRPDVRSETALVVSTVENEPSFLGELAVDQLLDAMAGDAQMMTSARQNAERALAAEPTQPSARLALGVLLVATELDWQQGRQLMEAARTSGDERLLALSDRLLGMYGVGAEPRDAGACDGAARVRTEGFIDLPAAQRLQWMNHDCFLALTHADAALRRRLGIEHVP